MNIISELNAAICGVLGTVTKTTSTLTESLEAGANMVHNRVKESDLTDKHFVGVRTAATLQIQKQALDADAELKAIYDDIMQDW